MGLEVDIDSYAGSLLRRAERIDSQLQQFRVELVRNMEQDIIRRTPVDTGQARGGWRREFVGESTWRIINRVRYAVILEYGGYRRVGPKTVRRGRGIASDQIPQGYRYIYSRQAPQGMVRITLAAYRRIMLQGARRIIRGK